MGTCARNGLESEGRLPHRVLDSPGVSLESRRILAVLDRLMLPGLGAIISNDVGVDGSHSHAIVPRSQPLICQLLRCTQGPLGSWFHEPACVGTLWPFRTQRLVFGLTFGVILTPRRALRQCHWLGESPSDTVALYLGGPFSSGGVPQ